MNDVLPAPLTGALLAALAPEPPARADRIRRRLLVRIASDARAARSLERTAGWLPFVAGADKKILFDDGRTMTWLVRMAPGAALPAHRHDDGDEECLVLEGTVAVNDITYGPGDYALALRGSEHRSLRTDTGALFLLRSPSPQALSAR
ncbi:MAG: cupin domain-containing protein [Pseudomonadota bacterium]